MIYECLVLPSTTVREPPGQVPASRGSTSLRCGSSYRYWKPIVSQSACNCTLIPEFRLIASPTAMALSRSIGKRGCRTSCLHGQPPASRAKRTMSIQSVKYSMIRRPTSAIHVKESTCVLGRQQRWLTLSTIQSSCCVYTLLHHIRLYHE